MDPTISFARQVHDLRKAQDLTQEALAEQVGCSVVTLKKIEQGRLRPSRQLAELLAAALEVAPTEQPAFVQRARQPLLAQSVPSRPPPTHRTNLPFPPTSLIGREQEVTVLTALLRGTARLVTLTGPPGIGKTRLALEAAHTLLADFPDGVWWVALAAVRDPRRVLPTIGRVFGLQEHDHQPLTEILRRHLHERQMVLVLDNFEQVLAAGPELSVLLSNCAHLRMLVTSRAPLHLSGEHVVEVPPLAVPDLARRLAGADLAQYPAVALLAARAQAVGAHLAPDEATAEVLAEICCRLEGIPLALELAAARLQVLSPPALLARLDQALPVLTGGARDLPPHQQTLRRAIAWSYDLLGADEQRLFRCLAVFRGGRSLEAITAVCNATGALAGDVLDGIAALVDQSLLYARAGSQDALRYGMLETIREYACEKLEESGESAEVQRQHALYFMRLAEEAEPELTGRQQAQWLARLEDEHDNIRVALRWAREHPGDGDAAPAGTQGSADLPGAEIGLRLAGALWRFWQVHGYYSEGRARLAAALRSAEQAAVGNRPGPWPGCRARALVGAGRLAWHQGDYATAQSHYEQALALWRELGDQGGMTDTLINLGLLAAEQGDHTAARALYEQSLAIAMDLGDTRFIARSLINLGQLASDQGDYATARAYYEQALALRRELGDQGGIANTLSSLGVVAYQQEDYATARSLYEQSLALWRELGDQGGMAMTLGNLGIVAQQQGDYTTARALYEQSLVIAQNLGIKLFIGHILNDLGHLDYLQRHYAAAREFYGQALGVAQEIGARYEIAESLVGLGGVAAAGPAPPLDAARLLGAAEVLLERTGSIFTVEDRVIYDRAGAAAREQLGEAGFEAARQAGRAMRIEQAVAYALDLARQR